MIQKGQNQKKAEDDNPRLFVEHLSELRSRLLIYLLTLLLLTGISFYFYPFILKFLLFPLSQKLFYTSPAGGLELMIKVSLLAGLIVSLPMLLFQILKFCEPALPSRLNRQIITFILCSFILTVLGLAFGYFIGLPAALFFLSGFSSDQIQSLITTQEYFSFVSRYLLGFSTFFQLPLVLYIINQFYPLSITSLLRWQRIVIVASLTLAAILTPTPDFVNQIIMALPLIVLFYFSVIILYFSNRIDKKKLS